MDAKVGKGKHGWVRGIAFQNGARISESRSLFWRRKLISGYLFSGKVKVRLGVLPLLAFLWFSADRCTGAVQEDPLLLPANPG